MANIIRIITNLRAGGVTEDCASWNIWKAVCCFLLTDYSAKDFSTGWEAQPVYRCLNWGVAKPLHELHRKFLNLFKRINASFKGRKTLGGRETVENQLTRGAANPLHDRIRKFWALISAWRIPWRKTRRCLWCIYNVRMNNFFVQRDENVADFPYYSNENTVYVQNGEALLFGYYL